MKKMNKSKIILSILGAVVILGGLALIVAPGVEDNATRANSELPKLGQIPDLELKDYQGNTVRLRDIKTEAVIINSWAVWCPFCKDELPDLANINLEFGDRVAVVAIDREEPLEVAKGFTDSIGVTEDMIFLLDPEDAFYRTIGGFTMPETIFADANGDIRIHKRGVMRIEEIREKTLQILNINNQ